MDFRVLSVLVALWALPAAAQTVVDGDTIKLDGTTYRIWGKVGNAFDCDKPAKTAPTKDLACFG